MNDISFGFQAAAAGAGGKTDQDLYSDLLEDCALGSKLGYDAAWLLEHHFSDYYPTPSPMLLMAHIAPISHMHYYAFGLVLAAGLWLKGLSQTNGVRPDWRETLPLVVWGVGTALPFTEVMPFEGEGVACSVVLWIAAIVRLGDRDAQFVAAPGLDYNSPGENDTVEFGLAAPLNRSTPTDLR